jgi:hypothetical protein
MNEYSKLNGASTFNTSIPVHVLFSLNIQLSEADRLNKFQVFDRINAANNFTAQFSLSVGVSMQLVLKTIR